MTNCEIRRKVLHPRVKSLKRGVKWLRHVSHSSTGRLPRGVLFFKAGIGWSMDRVGQLMTRQKSTKIRISGLARVGAGRLMGRDPGGPLKRWLVTVGIMIPWRSQ